MEDAQFKKILLAGNYVSGEDLAKAEDDAKKNHRSITDYLFASGLLTKDLLGQAIAESLGVPYADLNSNQPLRDQVLKIPEQSAKELHVVLFVEKKDSITLTTDDPARLLKASIKEGTPDPLIVLQKLFPDKKIEITYSLPEDIKAAFIHYQKPLETRFSKIIESQQRIAPEILEEIFQDAATFRASDIHFEPQGSEIVVRFRVDGALREAGRIPKDYYENILNRIKVLSNLRIDEHFATQDGAMHFEKEGMSIDMRTSLAPTIEGEKVVLRVLASYVQSFTLGDIGLSPTHQQTLEAAVNKPFGMILVAGPTGSGKTTTLYSLVKLVQNSEVNITTIEDPVEYKIRGVNQIQVNPLTNLTFAKGLRSIVRQDPDIILVGEIRDNETAEIAINAALTGHLLLSTFHANDAATAIPRLLDMGVEPFLLASTLEIIVAQRLVRKICEHCRQSVSAGKNEFFKQRSTTLYKGKGCNACRGTGHKGRTAIFEFIRITPEMEALILARPSTQQIWQLARAQGATSLFEDGLEKVKNGLTTIEELLRVAEPPI